MSTPKKCSCSWDECAWMSEQIDLFADDKHPWRGEYVTWRQRELCPKTICQKMLFLASACKHVPGVADAYKKPGESGYIYKKEISLAPHHFPVAIHEHKTTHKFKKGARITVKHNMTNFESDTAMKNIAAKEGLDRVKEVCNSVEALSIYLKKTVLPPKELLAEYVVEEKKLVKGSGTLFVCAPVATKTEVIDFVNGLSRKRAARLPLVSPTPKKMRLLPGASVTTTKMATLLEAADEVETLVEGAIPSYPPVLDSPDKVPTVKQCVLTLQSKCASMPMEMACLQTNFISSIRLLRSYHFCFEGIPIVMRDGRSTNNYLYPCKNDIRKNATCETFRVTDYHSSDGRFCLQCTKEHNHEMRGVRRINNPELSRSKGRRISNLPIENLRALAVDGRRREKNLKQRNNYLIQKLLQKQNREPKMPDLSECDASEFIKKVYKSVEMNPGDFSQKITSALLELHRDNENNSGKCDGSASKEEEARQFAEFIATEISNKSKQLSGKSKQVRYSSTTINLAMNVYLQSKKGYIDLKKRSLTALPCIRHLQHMKAAFRSMEGDNPTCYAPLLDTNYLKFCAGHLCVDEVKIKADLIWNVKNNELTGFCNVGTCPKVLKEQLRRIMEEDDELDCHAIYANQWRFRSVFCDHHTSEFYFNNGSLDCDELNRQLLGVVLNYESIGVRIHGVVSDAGGSNEGLFGMFREGIPILDDEHMLRPEQVSMRNPFCPERLIWFWHCSIHNVKNLRNTIWRSFIEGFTMPKQGPAKVKDMSKRKNCLMKVDERVHFGWQGMLDCYDRQSELIKTGKAGSTCISYQAVNLDSLTLMSVPYAKAAFSKRVLAEITDHIRSQLLDLLLKNDLDPERGECKGYDAMKDGAVGKRFLHYASVFRKAIPRENANRYYKVKSDILLLEYLATIHSIYTERFINPEWSINRDNIDKEIEAVRQMISLLGDWQKEKVTWKAESKPKDNKDWQKFMMSWKTYRNMRIGASGFFGYARDILDTYKEVSFVPAHHSNQSMIEAYFSKLRAHNHDLVSKVGCGVATSNAMSVIRAGKDIIDVVKGRELREERFEAWRGKSSATESAHVPILQTDVSLPEMKHPLAKAVLGLLTKRVATKGYAEFLNDSTLFADYAKLSIKTSQEKFFVFVTEGRDHDYVNTRCQSIVKWCIRTLDECLEAPSNSRRRLFYFHLYQNLCSQNADPGPGKEAIHNKLGWSVLHLILSKFVLAQVKHVFEDMKPAILKESIDIFETQKTDTNSFFGWSVFHMKKVLLRGANLEDWDDDSNDHETAVLLRLLQDLGTKESKIINDHDYVKNYYPFVKRIFNEGGLTLVDPKYIRLGHEIMLSITRQVSVEKLKMEGNAYTKACEKALVADISAKLLPLYLQLSESVTNNIKLRTKLFSKLVDKTFHCRIGAFLKYYYSVTKARGTKGEQGSGIREELKITARANANTKIDKITL